VASTQPLVMTSLVDRNGNTLSYARDGANRLTRVQDVHGRFVDLEYDNHGFIERLADSGGRVFTYAV
jgi:YD repeat-containing protein